MLRAEKLTEPGNDTLPRMEQQHRGDTNPPSLDNIELGPVHLTRCCGETKCCSHSGKQSGSFSQC